MLQTQMNKALPFEPAPQVPLYLGKFKEDLHVDKAAEHLAKFLKSCVEEMKLAAYALGKTDLAQFSREDMVCVDKDLAWFLDLDYAGFSHEEQQFAREIHQTIPDWPADRAEEQESPVIKNIH
ncbi:MAG: hypothetical protein A4E56_03296 [Pelotomaculum sp. PtaU1.Bin065]|nr:MAG: hypothetical protein A4E56_03296 [Pelotomaculum sp. PtaU1.Bin065]